MAEQQAIRQLVVIEDGTLLTMARDTRFVSQFPFLASLVGQRPLVRTGGCGGCGGRTAAHQTAFNAAKMTIAGLDGENKKKLKDLLGAAKLRVRYADGRKQVERTF